MTATTALLDLAARDCGDGPRHLIRLCLFDWLVCAIAGASEPVARHLRTAATGGGPVQIIGGGQSGPAEAALINGATGHALDYDDTHFDHIGHTSAAVMPAVLAVAEAAGFDALESVIDAALIGSESAVRVGVWLGRDHYQMGFHQTATSGAFGAAIGCGRLLGLDPGKMRHAIGLAGTQASGLKGQFGTMGKPVNAGLAARAGVEAALWASIGMTSDPDGLEQFGATHGGKADAAAWNGTDWRMARVHHKFHACCHGLHAMLEAVTGRNASTIHEATVTTHPRWLKVCNVDQPATGLQCKFSFRHTVAMALAGRSTSAISSYEDDAATDPKLVAIREKIRVEGDDTLTEMQARVDLTGSDGEAEHLFHDLAIDLPLDVREARLRLKGEAILGAADATALWSAVSSGEFALVRDAVARASRR